MKSSYDNFRVLLLENLKVNPGSQDRSALGNGQRPAVQQLLLMLLLGAIILLAIMVSYLVALCVFQLYLAFQITSDLLQPHHAEQMVGPQWMGHPSTP